MKKSPLKNILAAAIVALSANQAMASAPNSAENTEWNPAVSMTPALESTINVSHFDPHTTLFGADGPSPSNFALVVLNTEEGAQVLMCRDYDERLQQDGSRRPTHGTFKASSGFGMKIDDFMNSFDALVKGPANVALYNLLSSINGDNLHTMNLAYSESGEGWGPAATIPLFLTGDAGSPLSSDDVGGLLGGLNIKASEAFETREEGDTISGRFRDFKLIPLDILLGTGNDDPAVADGSKLVTITLDGKEETLWDENQMRKNLLPHVDAFVKAYAPK
jgi:hypothetical protein